MPSRTLRIISRKSVITSCGSCFHKPERESSWGARPSYLDFVVTDNDPGE